MSQIIAFPSAARTATVTSGNIKTLGHESVNVVFDVSSITLTPSLTLSIEAYDLASNSWRSLLSGSAVTTVSNNVYKIGPQLTASANLVLKDYVPSIIRVLVTHLDADSATYSVGVDLI